jgi:hypothetical protein
MSIQQLGQMAPSTTLASQIITAQDGTTATSINLNASASAIKVSSVGNGVLISFGSAPTTSNNEFTQFVVSGAMEYIPVPPGSANVQFLAISTASTTRVTVLQI